MDCPATQALLQDYLDGRLPPPFRPPLASCTEKTR